ncbi:MAG TPA: cyclodeaminase/cyclohydrolase family protein [Candidatus Omnitrophota bacterium]|nr:cyclodeaminase/cyclohydrolase family protein [Candidatus Omnitrophota bacterium]
MSYNNKTLREYLDHLAARTPAPGGGSASALAGALGCALLSMSCNFTLGKDKYKDVEPRIKQALKQSEGLRKRLLALVDLDVRAYYKVFKSRKASPEVYQRNLILATNVPLEICRLAVSGYNLCPLLVKIANKYLISDVRVGKELLKSCFKSAEFNVIINLPEINDVSFVNQTKRELANLKKIIKGR